MIAFVTIVQKSLLTKNNFMNSPIFPNQFINFFLLFFRKLFSIGNTSGFVLLLSSIYQNGWCDSENDGFAVKEVYISQRCKWTCLFHTAKILASFLFVNSEACWLLMVSQVMYSSSFYNGDARWLVYLFLPPCVKLWSCSSSWLNFANED